MMEKRLVNLVPRTIVIDAISQAVWANEKWAGATDDEIEKEAMDFLEAAEERSRKS